MAVVGAYLGVLRVTGIGPDSTIILTVCLMAILIGHVLWREKGAIIAVFVTGLVGAAQFTFPFISARPHGWDAYLIILPFWILFTCFGLLAYWVVGIVLRLGDWLDTLGGRQPTPGDS